ncbi:hypothetical protein MAPG_08423 [Magnaporthiopsis poae ATCC 64411]|uniref:Uncharacterized protein n=1 Tax=Magnaporthiopsis poae (strain ATCC 64411 / 73-15) TaxID=644358 RepID=A0A0C4E7B5_MAGP6|nr:hypothetical protein MAPG_08423 [Magnaporthiopsis poae ATCC 64411]
MGIKMSPHIYRFLSMRNPFGRAVVFAAISLILIALSLHSSSTDRLRRAVIVTTDSFRHGEQQQQRPLSDTPVWPPSPPPVAAAGQPNSTEPSTGGGARFDAETMACEDDFAHLRKLRQRYGLQPKFEYYKRHVQISRRQDVVERKVMTEVDDRFLVSGGGGTKFRLVDTDGRTASHDPCPGPEPLRVPVTNSPVPSTANLSDFFFGVSTTYQRFSEPFGSGGTTPCIYENTAVRLTIVPELWQLDLMGDPSGFYESGVKPLSLHHYRGGMWHIGYPTAYTRLAHLCGEDCTLQRFRTNDGFVIAAGFSVAQYPLGMDDLDTDQMERTFRPAPDDKGWNLDFALGTQRRNLARTGRKISWDLQESTLRPDGSVSQIYVRKADDPRWIDWEGNRMRGNDGVVELVWIL